jgi:Virulence factor
VAQVTVTYWRDIPVLVTARDGAEEATVALSSRFQDLVDAVAMQAGLSDSEAYLAEWRTGAGEGRPGTAQTAASEAAAELEEQFGEIRTRYQRPGGPFNAH